MRLHFFSIHKRATHLFLIALFGLVLYFPSLSVPFQLDDHELLLGNPLIRNPQLLLGDFAGTRKFFTFLSFSANYASSGRDPLPFHVVNIVLHILAAFLVYFSFRKLFSSPGGRKEKLAIFGQDIAFCAALIFITHPLQTQAVTYIWQRAEIVSTIFVLLTYFFYLHGRIRLRKVFYAVAFLFFLLGLKEKGTILCLPLLVLLTESLFFENLVLQRIAQGIAAGALLFLYSSLLPFPWMQSLHNKVFLLGSKLTSFPVFREYFLTQWLVWVRYLQLSFFPFGQNIEHDVRLVASAQDPQVLIPLLILSAMWLAAVRLCRDNRFAAFGVFWFFVCLLPTSFVMREPMWEHRVYLSLAGFGISLSAMLFQFVLSPAWRKGIAIGVLAMLVCLTEQRNHLWQSPVALLEDAVQKSPFKARPHLMLANLYLRSSRIPEAEEMYLKTIQLSPDYPEPYNNLGVICARRGDFAKAEKLLQAAAGLRANFVMPLLNLGDMATIGIFPDYAKAKKYYQQALQRDPGNGFAALKLADLARLQKDNKTALIFYDQALLSDPRLWQAYYGKGQVYFGVKDFAAAQKAFATAKDLSPGEMGIYQRLADTCLALGEREKAEKYLREGKEKSSEWQKRNP